MATALITGASSGIGAAFAQALAARGVSVILTARSTEKLQSLAQSLTTQFGIQAIALPLDLSEPGAADQLAAQVKALGQPIDWLINNAGFGDFGEFATRDLAKQRAMLNLNVVALTELTHHFLQPMLDRGQGQIINVASTAAFQPIPYLSLYAATKAFVLSFSEGLWVECQGRGVRVMALCPGPTATNFAAAAEFPGSLKMPNDIATPEAVVQEALQAIAQGKPNCVTGGLANQILVNAGRFMPRSSLIQGIGKLFRSASTGSEA